MFLISLRPLRKITIGAQSPGLYLTYPMTSNYQTFQAILLSLGHIETIEAVGIEKITLSKDATETLPLRLKNMTNFSMKLPFFCQAGTSV